MLVVQYQNFRTKEWVSNVHFYNDNSLRTKKTLTMRSTWHVKDRLAKRLLEPIQEILNNKDDMGSSATNSLDVGVR